MKRLAVVIAVLSIHAAAVAGQQTETPKPGPEHQRLGAFVGNWTFEGEMKAGPTGPGGKITGTDRIEWLPGNFFVQRRFEGISPMGKMSGVEILAYDSAKKVYTYNAFDSTGTVGSGTLTVNGSTWTTSGTMSMGGNVMRDRCTLAFGAGETTITISCEMTADGTSWTPTFQGKATKSK